MKRKLIVLIMIVACSATGLSAQVVQPGFEFSEIYNISETYRQAPHLSFDMQFQYADSLQPSVILEQMPGSCKMQNGQYWTMIDSTEFLQGNQYYLAVYHNESTIAVNDLQNYSSVLQLPFMDSLFRSQNIDSMYVTPVNDSTNRFNFHFRPGSLFSNYVMNYDVNSYYIRSIQYYTHEQPVDADSSGSGTSIISVNFSNYNTSIIDESYFNEKKFIYRQGTQFIAKPEYAGFTLLVNTSN